MHRGETDTGMCERQGELNKQAISSGLAGGERGPSRPAGSAECFSTPLAYSNLYIVNVFRHYELHFTGSASHIPIFRSFRCIPRCRRVFSQHQQLLPSAPQSRVQVSRHTECCICALILRAYDGKKLHRVLPDVVLR